MATNLNLNFMNQQQPLCQDRSSLKLHFIFI